MEELKNWKSMNRKMVCISSERNRLKIFLVQKICIIISYYITNFQQPSLTFDFFMFYFTMHYWTNFRAIQVLVCWFIANWWLNWNNYLVSGTIFGLGNKTKKWILKANYIGIQCFSSCQKKKMAKHEEKHCPTCIGKHFFFTYLNIGHHFQNPNYPSILGNYPIHH